MSGFGGYQPNHPRNLPAMPGMHYSPQLGPMPAQFGGLGLARGSMGGGMMGGSPQDQMLAASMAGWQRQQAVGYGMQRLPWHPWGRGLSNAEGDRLWRAIGGWSSCF